MPFLHPAIRLAVAAFMLAPLLPVTLHAAAAERFEPRGDIRADPDYDRQRHRFDPRRDVDVGVVLPPEQLEHWRSNYVPDDYRISGYDGVSDGNANVCRHGDGSVSISTSGVDCPNGQSTPEGGRSWSVGNAR
ncbi:hypothetical protein [Kushneria aurantia]|uniref:Secreted protein n=1 Tax=Kushneria aurantia TaxID=504092 RepID=A0ABV6G742_9GAMM|nr:hypothetical protein [Kushneria aurantia]